MQTTSLLTFADICPLYGLQRRKKQLTTRLLCSWHTFRSRRDGRESTSIGPPPSAREHPASSVDLPKLAGLHSPPLEGWRLVYERAVFTGRTMSLLVLSTRAKISRCSAVGTWNLSRHACKSPKKTCHSSSVMSRWKCEPRIERPGAWG